MAQYPPAIAAVDSSALQTPITLQSSGNMIQVGAPGGPVIFTPYGAMILTALAGNPARNSVGQK